MVNVWPRDVHLYMDMCVCVHKEVKEWVGGMVRASWGYDGVYNFFNCVCAHASIYVTISKYL